MQRHYVSALLLTGVLMAAPAPFVSAHDEGEAGMGMEHKEQTWDEGKLQKDLGLSKDQASKMKAARESQKTAMKILRDKQHELIEKLEGQVKNKAADSEIEATLTDIRTNRKAMADQKQSFDDQKEGILTPTQRAKMLLMHHERMEHRGMRHHPMMEKDTMHKG